MPCGRRDDLGHIDSVHRDAGAAGGFVAESDPQLPAFVDGSSSSDVDPTDFGDVII